MARYIYKNGNIEKVNKSNDFLGNKTNSYLEAVKKDALLNQMNDTNRNYYTALELSKNKKNTNKWFKKGAFKDGYQVGDATVTFANTLGDAVTGAIKGVGNLAEGVVDLGTYGVAGASKLLGADKFSEKAKKFAQKNLVNNSIGSIQNEFDKYSVLGDKSDSITEGLGYVGGIIATGGLGASAGLGTLGTTALTTAATGTSAMGSGMNEAYLSGATDEEAVKYGLISGVAEAGTELIFGGLGKGINAIGISKGLSSADDMLAKKISSKFKSQLAKNLTEYTVKSLAEGSEEVMSGVIQAIGKKMTYLSEEDLSKIMKDEQLLDQFISGAIISGISQAPSLVKSNIKGQDFIQKETVEQNKILPTVNDIVKQESNINNDYEIKKRSISPTSDAFVAPNRTSETDGAFASDNNSNTNIIKNQGNLKIKKYTNDDIKRFLSGNNLIDGINAELNSFVKKYYDPITKKAKKNSIPVKTQKLFLGRINDNLASKLNTLLNNSKMIQEKLGIKYDTKDTNIVISSNNIEHSYNQHGVEKRPGQIDVTPENLSKYGEVVSNPDYIGLSSQLSRGKTPTLYFTKKINGYSVAVEVLSTKKQLYPESYYVFESDSKEYLEFIKNNKLKKAEDVVSNDIMSNDINALGDTSVAFSANNIPQSNQNVKSSILPITNNMQSSENNAINMPPVKKNTKPSKKSKQIAKILNETIKNDALEVKQRKWIETSLESEIVKDKVFLEDLDFNKVSYVVQSNKKTLDKANNKLDSMGYETSIKYIQSKINDNDISLTDIVLAERLIQEAINKGDTQLASDLIMDTAILGTDLGQKVQALSIIQRLTPEGQLRFYQKLVQRAKAKGDTSFQNVEITPEMVELILNAYKADGTFEQNDLNSRVEQFKEKVAEQLITTKSEKIVAWRYLSMLGNPKTHIRNMVSNVAMWGTQNVKNAVARTIETVVPIENRTKTWKKASQEVSDYAKKTTEQMREIITGESKYSEKASIERKKQTFKNKTIEKIKDINSNLLSKEDWIFSKTAFENSLKEYLTAQNIITNEDIANNSEIIEKAKLYAIKEAEKATFRQYSWLASQISKIENKNALTKIVVGSTIPFKKTPINIAKTGASYSPLGLIKTISYDAYQVSKGNMEASQFIDNLSQGLTGTSLMLIGYALSKAGILKGAGDDDKEGKYDSYLGNQTYSIRIGNSTYSISWLSPVAMPLLVGATAYEKLEKQAEWDMNVVVDTLAQTLDPLSEMSFLSSLDDVLSSYDSGIKKFAGMAGSMGQNYLTQFIPTLFSQIAATLDDKKRTTRASNNSSWKFGEETVRKLMYKVPILRNQLEASTDIWGNEIKQSDNIIERAFENFIAPYSRKEDISTSLDEELKRLYNSTGETSVIPGVPKAYVKYKDVTYQMSAKEYTKYKKTYGNTANTYLTKLVENKNYINATDEQKASMVKEVYSYASALANEEYFSEKDVEYENDSLKEINKIKELKMTNTQIVEYVAQKKIISSIKSDEQLTASEKKKEISEYLINAKLNDKQLAYLYDKYYSSEKVLDNLLNANIPIKEFIKFNSQEFTTDYYENGKAITNSRKLKVINYINSLNLSVPQKALLIKMEYSSYDSYDNQIIKYINNLDYSKFEKASLLKSFGFSAYDKYLIDYVNNMNISKEEKSKMLEDMGFTIRNGKVYSK